MKIFISADIEGVNGIITWDETEPQYAAYDYFRKQMTKEVQNACLGANAAGANEIFIKDAHDTARNLILDAFPENAKVHRGWEGCPCSMMAGLDKSFDAVLFIGYHSPASSDGNPLAHTMNTKNLYVKINGKVASEFYINALYASYIGVPIAFLSGDKRLTELVKEENKNITTVVTKEGVHGAVVSQSPSVTNEKIKKKVQEALSQDLRKNFVELPKHFNMEIAYKHFKDAYNASFYPGCKLLNENTVSFETDDYYEVLRAMKFIL